MIRFNTLLLLAAVFCALGIVTSQHKARKLFQALEAEQRRAEDLDVEFDQLQLELSTWATSPSLLFQEQTDLQILQNMLFYFP